MNGPKIPRSWTIAPACLTTPCSTSTVPLDERGCLFCLCPGDAKRSPYGNTFSLRGPHPACSWAGGARAPKTVSWPPRHEMKGMAHTRRCVPWLSRRDFLLRTSSAAAGLILGSRLGFASPQARFTRDPFSLGVASGYPRPDGFVLWTRLAPDPLEGGGMPPKLVRVSWEVATRKAHTRRAAGDGDRIARLRARRPCRAPRARARPPVLVSLPHRRQL